MQKVYLLLLFISLIFSYDNSINIEITIVRYEVFCNLISMIIRDMTLAIPPISHYDKHIGLSFLIKTIQICLL